VLFSGPEFAKVQLNKFDKHFQLKINSRFYEKILGLDFLSLRNLWPVL
jgi:hypothetical protein